MTKMISAVPVMLMVLLVSGCASLATAEPPTAPAVPEPPAAAAPAGGQAETTVVIHLGRVGDDGMATTERVSRTVEGDGPEQLLRAAIERVIAGPDDEERTAGLTGAIPADTRVLSVVIERPYAIIDLSREFEDVGGTARVSGMLDQLVNTAVEFLGVKAVELRIEGEPVCDDRPFTGEGVTQPYGRLLPWLDEEWLAGLFPDDVLDLFIAAIPDPDAMWELMAVRPREIYAGRRESMVTELSEGLGAWRGYELTSVTVDGDRASVVIEGHVTREGMSEYATYDALLTRVDGRWRFDFRI